jgi:hypothetical protein
MLRYELAEGMTRARVRFVAYGEKTFVLEQAPIRKLERPAR